MFDKAKTLFKFKQKADAIKKQREAIFVEVEERGVKIKMRGDNHVETVSIDGTEDKRLKEAFNKAIKETEKKVEKKLQGEFSDLGIPGLS